jgi:N-acetylglutamate synthase-like GNAT family acetyltransferase
MREKMLSLVPQSDTAELAAALTAAKLPSDDVSEDGRRFWRAVDETGRVVGYGGIEGGGADVLLRSVVILPARRGAGLGRALIDALLREAKGAGSRRVWLLTTGAADFFDHLGFERQDRAKAPSVVTQSRQFTALCPASAAVLVRAL